MALDGICVAHMVYQLNNNLIGVRIDKVQQPEKDELILSVRGSKGNYRLLLSANAANPRICVTSTQKENPMQAPLFCMVLRKHIGNGRIVKIHQPDFERVVELHIEAMNEMGDLSVKRLIIEIMGKHSNIILLNENGVIIDAIKHISLDQSSVREVMPARVYSAPPSQKHNPLLADKNSLLEILKSNPTKKAQTVLYQNYNGISPTAATEICYRAGIIDDNCENIQDINALIDEFISIFVKVKNGDFEALMYSLKQKPVEFSSISLNVYSSHDVTTYDSLFSCSEMIEGFYSGKDNLYRVNQKTTELRKLITKNIERCLKKRQLHYKTEEDIKDRDILKLNGELITSNIYMIKKGMTCLDTANFYADPVCDISIVLDPTLSPSENAQYYFNKYNKCKRTYSALQIQKKQNEEELAYLEAVLNSLNIITEDNVISGNSVNDSDIDDIREELITSGYLQKKNKKQQAKTQKRKESLPLNYESDGFNIFVGKNNKQNDELTLKTAEKSDLWFHTKDIPGAHVIIKCDGKQPNESVMLTAANLAAFYSKAKNGSMVPVDYTFVKNVKKPNGAKPGMVIYVGNKTMFITPDVSLIPKYSEKTLK